MVMLLSVLWTTGCSWFLSSVLKVVTYEKCVKLNFPELVLLAPLQHSWEFVSSYLDVILTLKLFKSSWIQIFFYISMNPLSGGGQSAICNS